jgi:hypothetical protein
MLYTISSLCYPLSHLSVPLTQLLQMIRHPRSLYPVNPPAHSIFICEI